MFWWMLVSENLSKRYNMRERKIKNKQINAELWNVLVTSTLIFKSTWLLSDFYLPFLMNQSVFIAESAVTEILSAL